MPSGFRINRQGIKKFTRELDKELQTQWRRQHRGMPVRLDEGTSGYGPAMSDDHSTHFYGPVTGPVAVGTHGDVTQTAIGGGQVDVAMLESVARDLRAALPAFGAEHQAALEETLDALLAETATDAPEDGRLHRLGRELADRLGAVATGAAGGILAQQFSPLILTAIG